MSPVHVGEKSSRYNNRDMIAGKFSPLVFGWKCEYIDHAISSSCVRLITLPKRSYSKYPYNKVPVSV
jgi:hypothetical protein